VLIRDIKIQGFRSLWDVKISGFGPVNIFYGENDSGKSNILAALDVIFRVDKPETLESPLAGFYRSSLSNFVDNYTLRSHSTIAPKITLETTLELDDADLRRLDKFTDFITDQKIVGRGHAPKINLKM